MDPVNDKRKQLHNSIVDDLGLMATFPYGQLFEIKNCWHFSCDGNNSNILFRDIQDFIKGMNRIAICYLHIPVIILAFCLMDNHFHFVLYGDFCDCAKFAKEYMKMTGLAISKKYMDTAASGLSKLIDYSPVQDNNYLCRVIAYDILNPVAAGLKYTFYDYPWSSGSLYFRSCSNWTSPYWNCCNSETVSSMSIRTERNFFGTHTKFPDNWMVIQGLIFPGHYVDYKMVEKIYRTQRAFSFFVSRNKNDNIDSETSMIGRIGLSDMEIRLHRDELLASEFQSRNIRSLSVPERLTLAKELRRRYASSKKQIARVVCLPASDLEHLL